jgi:hypothetical protein
VTARSEKAKEDGERRCSFDQEIKVIKNQYGFDYHDITEKPRY